MTTDAHPATAPIQNLACLILAAGKGTRMRSGRSKVLHEVLGEPLVSYPVRRAQELGASPIIAVLGHQRDQVERTLTARHGAGAVNVVEQTEQRGTGHAVRLAMAPLSAFDGVVLILYGDVPLLTRETLEALVAPARQRGCLTVLTATVADATGYGRIVRDATGRVARIVEDKDATADQRGIGEINAGIYAAPAAFLREATARLSPKNAQGEYYLTDVVEQAASSIGAVAVAGDALEISGINDRLQLAQAEELMRARLVARHHGLVTFVDPAAAVVEQDVLLEADVVVGRHVALRGRTRIAAGAVIGDGCVLVDAVVGADARLGAHVVAEGVEIAAGTVVPALTRLGSRV